MDLSIRDATPADAEAIVSILNPIIEARKEREAKRAAELEAAKLNRDPQFNPRKVTVQG